MDEVSLVGKALAKVCHILISSIFEFYKQLPMPSSVSVDDGFGNLQFVVLEYLLNLFCSRFVNCIVFWGIHVFILTTT